MVYFYNNEYYVLVSSDKLVKVNATLNSSGSVTYIPTNIKVRLSENDNFKKYKVISNEEVVKALTANSRKKEVKEVKVKDDFISRKIIKSKDID